MSFSSDQPTLINQLPQTVNLPTIGDSQLFQDQLEDLLRNISNNCNGKTGGLYTLQEQFNSEQYYQTYVSGQPIKFRNVYRKVMDFIDENGGNIGGSASVDFAHGISSIQESAGIWAHCTSVDGRRFTASGPNIYVTSTRAYFTNPYTAALTQCDLVIQILKEV